MARLVGVDLPREKRVEIALTYIFGVGRTRSQEMLTATGINPNVRVKDLPESDLVKLRDYIEGNFKIEGDLRREIAADIRRKVEIQCYPRNSSPQRSAGARATYPHQRTYSQGSTRCYRW